MEKRELLEILKYYKISSITEYREIDSTKGDDYRLNVIIDNKYVLRINNPTITEERLQSISRLCERYRSINVLTPHLYKSIQGTYLISHGKHVCYVSDYLNYATEEESENECDHTQVRTEVLHAIGALSAKYSDVDLIPVNSMWSLIDLAPLDIDIDEKQENLNTLVDALINLGESSLANRVSNFNTQKRNKIRAVYKHLPRCVIQGDLNSSNILVENNHFVGLIDFNMAGTEVNVNHFCCETNGYIQETDFLSKKADVFYKEWLSAQNKELDIILSEYPLNGLEKSIIEDYRSICLIAQYPNVMDYLRFLKLDKEKTLQVIELILQR